jgi:hypothetical protein
VAQVPALIFPGNESVPFPGSQGLFASAGDLGIRILTWLDDAHWCASPICVARCCLARIRPGRCPPGTGAIIAARLILSSAIVHAQLDYASIVALDGGAASDGPTAAQLPPCPARADCAHHRHD